MGEDKNGSASPLGVPSPLSLTPSGVPERQTPSTIIHPEKPSLNIHTAFEQDTRPLESSDVEPLSLPSVGSPASDSVSPIHNGTGSEERRDMKGKPPLQLPPEAFKRPIVTASAILSRSGRLHPIPRSRGTRSGSFTNGPDVGYFTAMHRAASADSHVSSSKDTGTGYTDNELEEETSFFASLPSATKDLWGDSTDPENDRLKKGKQHTGSAIEAIGALFLRQDSAGRLDQLSLQRDGQSSSIVKWPLNMPLWLTMFETRAWLTSIQQWLMQFISQAPSEDQPRERPTVSKRAEKLENLPPTPVAMPGSYMHDFDDSLLLPPPLLDESSDPRSFEGILGVRRMREQQQKKKRLDSLRERNRPAHRVDMFTAFSNFVRSAQASETHHAENKTSRRRRLGFGMNLHRRYPEHRTREEIFSSLRSEWAKPRMISSNASEQEFEVASDDESHAKTTAVKAKRPLLRRHATVDPDRMLREPVKATSVPSEKGQLKRKASDSNLSATVSPKQSPSHAYGQGSDSASQPTHRLTPRAMLDRALSDSLSNSPATSRSGDMSSRQETPAVTAEVSYKDADLSSAWLVISCLFLGVTFVPDFVVFSLAHLLDFAMDAYEVVRQGLWFIRWLWLNITGQTVLGRCIYEAYGLFQSEWAYVAREDHEARGERRHKLQRLPVIHGRRGLSAFQVIRGILELACIQAVTRERYQREGAGLEILQNWRKNVTAPPTPAVSALDGGEEDDDDDNDDLVVTSRTKDILEISRTATNTRRKRQASLSEQDAVRRDAALGIWDEDNAALVRNVKWASQLAMSAYGLQVLIVDLPPVFTPSGRQFPQQTFAHLSRLDADDVLHADIQTLDEEASYSPTFYIVRDMRRKVVCVAVRGTQSFADIVVDLDMRTEDITSTLSEWRGVELESHSERFAYHAGIWRAARELVKPGSTLFNKLCDTLNEHEDFGLVFVGHSLGGAIASAATILLSEYHLEEEDPNSDPCKGTWLTSGMNGFPEGRRIRAITFAHPSTVSNNLSARASFGSVPLVTSVILRSDIIPRFGHGQVRELRRVLGALTRVRRRRAMVSTTISSNPMHAPEREEAVVHVLRRFWDWLSICRNDRPDSVMLDRKRRLENLFWRLRCEVEDDLYSQAKRRFDEMQLQINAPNSPWVRAQKPEEVSLHTLSRRRQRLDDATLSSETAIGGPLVPAGRILWLEKGEIYNVTNPMSFFSLPDLQVCDMRLCPVDHVSRPFPSGL